MARHITVVNDNPEFLEVMRDILEDERYAVTTIDGDLDGALRRVLESRPDLLILDLRMGSDQLHGWDIAQEIRRAPALQGLPVIICSADVVALRALAEDMAEGQSVRTLEKPFGVTQLIDVVDEMLVEAAAS